MSNSTSPGLEEKIIRFHLGTILRVMDQTSVNKICPKIRRRVTVLVCGKAWVLHHSPRATHVSRGMRLTGKISGQRKELCVLTV